MSLKNKIQENINSLTPLGRYLFTCILVVLPYFILYAICNVLAKYHIFDTITTFFDTHQLFIIILALLAFIIACIFIDSDKWHKCKSFARDNALIVVLLLLYIFFYRFWEGLIRDYIIDKFLCNYESNLLSIFIICLACLGLVWLEGNRLGKRISPRKKLIYISALCFWVYYRWICNQFGPEKTSCQLSFVSLLNNGYLKYIDIVPFIALCEILPSVFAKEEDESYYVRRNQGETTGYITDNPIKKNDDDILKRDSFVTSAIQELLKTDIVDGAYTFGINSPWGAGKTSFINLMKEQIQNPYSGYNSNSILIDFNPWLYATEKDLVSAFFDELSKYLKQYDLSLAKDIIDYSKLLSAFGTKETKLIASLIELTKNDPSTLQKKKDRITNTL